MKRKVSTIFFVIILMLVICFGNKVPANCVQASGNPTIEVSTEAAEPGEEVTIKIIVKNNPGIMGMQLELHYDQNALQIVGAKNMQLFDIGTISKNPSTYPFVLMWESNDMETNMMRNGVVAEATFHVRETVDPGMYAVKIRYDEECIFNKDYENIAFETIDGGVKVLTDSSDEKNVHNKISDDQMEVKDSQKTDVDVLPEGNIESNELTTTNSDIDTNKSAITVVILLGIVVVITVITLSKIRN